MGALCFVPPQSQKWLTLSELRVIICEGVSKMPTNVRLQVMISPKTLEKLQILSNEKGVSKAALVSLAIDKLWKEEEGK